MFFEFFHLRIFANKKVGYDCGPEAGEWFSKFLEIEGLRVCYLIKRGEANVKRDLPDSMVKYPYYIYTSYCFSSLSSLSRLLTNRLPVS